MLTENPYSFADEVPDPIATERPITNSFVHSRNAIAVISILFWLSAILICVRLGFDLYLYIAKGVEFRNDFRGYLNQGIRSVWLGFMALTLWQYQLSIKNLVLDNETSVEEFAKLHNRFWTVTAILMIVQLCFAFSPAVQTLMEIID